jgi:hypothetical protein
MFAGGVLGAWLLHEGVRPAVVLGLPATLILLLGAATWAAPERSTSEPG